MNVVDQALDNRRSFFVELSDGSQEKYYIGQPSGKDVRESDWLYAKTFNKALVDNLPTQAQMLESLKSRGIYSDAYLEELNATKIRLAASIYKLNNLTGKSSDEEKSDIAKQAAALREDLFNLSQKVNGPMSYTCENMAEDSRVDYLTSRIVQNEDKTPVWKSFDEYANEPKLALVVRARFECMLSLQGIQSDFIENVPEQKVLREVAQRRLDSLMRQVTEESSVEEDPAKAPEVENIDLNKVLAIPEISKSSQPKSAKRRSKKN